ncbi:MAG TPA: thermonuclease family protein [Haliangiales bacterium]|nr:thermonuclease family protein [Haliangiales bacterium]
MSRASCLVLLLGACGSPSDRCGPSQGMVKSVIDGDTIILEDDTRVRYILVDTNEITNGHNDCYGQEAKQYNALLVEGRVVDLAYDTECTDRFGRALAYVSIQGREVNRLLVERGYGCVLYIPPDGMAKVADYRAAEAEARAAMRGMWGACPVVACAH